MVEQFADSAGGFFTTARGPGRAHRAHKDPHDGSTPSGNAMAVTGLLRLAEADGNDPLARRSPTAG